MSTLSDGTSEILSRMYGPLYVVCTWCLLQPCTGTKLRSHSVHVLTIDTDPHIQFKIVLANRGLHEIPHSSRLDVRKIKYCQHTTSCAANYPLSVTCFDFSIFPTLIRKPAHPPPRAIEIAAKYPTFASFIQHESAAAFTLFYSEREERLISDDIMILLKSANRLLALIHPKWNEDSAHDTPP
jgi:hypothetical protein